MDLNDDIFEGLDENTECEECEITYTNAEQEEPAEPEKPEKQENKWALRDRLRSKAAWSSFIGAITLVISAFNLWDSIGITQWQFKVTVTAIGTVLTAFGIWNDPTSKGRF